MLLDVGAGPDDKDSLLTRYARTHLTREYDVCITIGMSPVSVWLGALPNSIQWVIIYVHAYRQLEG